MPTSDPESNNQALDSHDGENPAAPGRLKVFMGFAPGVGKTYSMLNEAHRRKEHADQDVVVGFVETHGRHATEAQVGELEIIPRRTIEHDGVIYEEMDVDAVIARRPEWAVVDEFAHTNAPGVRNAKRYQDILDLLDAGINVLSTIDVQNLESVNDTAEQITGVSIHETAPDWALGKADEIVAVDITPRALINRVHRGDIFASDEAPDHVANLFVERNLSALRELALREVASEVDRSVQDPRVEQHVHQPWRTHERVIDQILHGEDRGRAVVMLDREGRVTVWSTAAAHIFGWTREEFVGRHIGELFMRDDRDRRKPEELLSLVLEQGFIEEEGRRLTKDGAVIWTDMSVTAIRDAGEPIAYLVVFRDITKRKQAESERNMLLAQQQRIAERLQRSLLLITPNRAIDTIDISTHYEAASLEAKIGGDFYDIYNLAESRVALVVGDVTGKGLEAAIHGAEVKFALRAFLHQNQDPAEAMQRLDDFLIDGQRLENNTLDAFVSLSLVIIDTHSGDVVAVNAGAEPALLVRSTGEVQELNGGGGLLGVDTRGPYGSVAVTLDRGDLIGIATDGITESRRGGVMFGIGGFARVLQDHVRDSSLEDIGAAVLRSAKDHAGGSLLDDACVLLVRRR
jgi:PAS domain S-box-containing protein